VKALAFSSLSAFPGRAPAASKLTQRAEEGVMLKSNLMVIRFNKPVVGREQEAVAFFGRTLDVYAKWQAAGRIHSFEEVVLSPHSSDMNGLFLVRGEPDKLTALRQSDDFMAMVYQSGYFLEGFGVIEAYSGEVLRSGMQDWGAVIAASK
jgi:hypothetical protein